MPDVFELLGNSFNIYKKNIKSILLLGFIPFLFYTTYNIVNVFKNDNYDNSFAVVLFIVFSVLSSIIMLISKPVFIYALKDLHENKNIDVESAYKKSLTNFWQILWVTILSGLVMVSGMSLFVIPGIALSGYLVFSLFFIVTDNDKGINALAKSFYYVRDNWLNVFVRIFVLGLLFFLVYAIFFLVLSLAVFCVHILLGMDTTLIGNVNGSSVLLIPIWIKELYSIFTNIITYLFLVPISMILSYEIFKFLISSKPKPSESDLETPRKWFVGLSIAGAIIPLIFVALIGLLILVLSATGKVNFKKNVNFEFGNDRMVNQRMMEYRGFGNMHYINK